MVGSRRHEIHHKILNTKENGVPQHRPRWYCVGIRKDTFSKEKSSFEFPAPIEPCPSIDLFLDEAGRSEKSGLEKLGAGAKR